MLLFLLFDFCFSSSIAYYAKRSILASKDDKYKKISEIFGIIRKKFAVANVSLYIIKTDDINAYAVGSLRKNIVVMTTGLLKSYKDKTENNTEKFLLFLEGIMAHEMSHIANRDYFTALLLIINERATNFVSKIIWLLFNFFIKIVGVVPVIGYYMAMSITSIYNALDFIIVFFYKHIMLNIYKFIQLQISKSIEYRADEQAARVIGGQNMADALSFLGSNGYFSIFSTHPTTKQRVRNIEKIAAEERNIRPVFGSGLAVTLSFLLMAVVLCQSYRLANVNGLLKDYREIKFFFVNRYIVIKTAVLMFFNRYFGL
jgi:Zn-dependent protease with chaperone function